MNMKERRIRVVVVDDHPGVRKGIKNLLKKDKEILVVGEASNGKEAIRLVLSQKPNILLLDVELPLLKGDEVARRVRDIHPEVRVLAVSSYSDRFYVQGMLETGAVGYITKDEAPEMLLAAIHSVVNEGTTWVSPGASKHLDNIKTNEPTLTRREIEILNHLQKGEPEKIIAQNLGISEQRLQKHLQILMSKFEAESTAALIRVARKLTPGASS